MPLLQIHELHAQRESYKPEPECPAVQMSGLQKDILRAARIQGKASCPKCHNTGIAGSCARPVTQGRAVSHGRGRDHGTSGRDTQMEQDCAGMMIFLECCGVCRALLLLLCRRAVVRWRNMGVLIHL